MSDNMVVLPGERCRKAREALGWTPAEAANRLHLSQSYLVALEADDYERLPEATFVKGYLKNYAKLLGLPADEIANTFQQMVNDDAFDKPLDLPKIAPAPSVWRKPLLIVIALLAIIALLIWLWPGGEGPAPFPGDMNAPKEQAPLSAADEAEVDVASGMDDLSASSPESEATQPESAEPLIGESLDDSGDEGQPEQQSSEAADKVGASDESGPSMLAENGLDRLIMAFSGNCWIRVKDAAGRTLRQGEQQPGTSLQLDGEAPFSLTVGDAGAVDELVLNGEAVTLPTNSPGSVVRVTIP